MPDVPLLSGRRVAALALAATALHAAFDAVTYRVAAARPPYLRLEDAPDVFQMLSPVAVSIAVCCISGIIGVIAVAAVHPWQRRPRLLAAIVTAFWLFSAVLLRAVWLSTPWTATLLALLFGLPRGFVVGWCLAYFASPLTAPTGEEA